MSKRAVPRDTRTALLDASAREFAAYGLNGARIQSIVDAARVNERMIYHYFGSKERLYVSVLEREWLAVADAWQPALAVAGELTPREGLVHAFGALARGLRGRPLFMRMMLDGSITRWGVAPAATHRSVPKHIATLHRRGVTDGTFRGDVEFSLVYMAIMGVLVGCSLFTGRFKSPRGRDSELSERATALVLDGLARRSKEK